jgi:hypothetical protein
VSQQGQQAVTHPIGPARDDYMKTSTALVARAGSQGVSEKNERNDVERAERESKRPPRLPVSGTCLRPAAPLARLSLNASIRFTR